MTFSYKSFLAICHRNQTMQAKNPAMEKAKIRSKITTKISNMAKSPLAS